MNEARNRAACVLYDGKILVTGGGVNPGYNATHTAEIYDSAADTWSHFPGMMEQRAGHGSVVSGRKVFVIGAHTRGYFWQHRPGIFREVEYYDPDYQQFVALTLPPKCYQYRLFWIMPMQTVYIGGKIYIFQENDKEILTYDVERNEWSSISQIPRNYVAFACVKAPQF